VQLATLRLLWHDPRFQTLENLKHWLYNVLCSDPAHWLTLQTDILQLMDPLHPRNLPHLRRLRRYAPTR